MRPPASELAATKPTSDAALTLNGSSLTVSSPVELGAGAVWPRSDCTPRPSTMAAAATWRLRGVGFMGVGFGKGWLGSRRRRGIGRITAVPDRCPQAYWRKDRAKIGRRWHARENVRPWPRKDPGMTLRLGYEAGASEEAPTEFQTQEPMRCSALNS